MADKKNASPIARIASLCGLIYLCLTLASIALSIAGVAASGILALLVGLLLEVIAPLIGLAGIILGIIALCTLTPEEKQESVWASGTTKNCALVGIVVPPLMFVLGIVAGVVIAVMRS